MHLANHILKVANSNKYLINTLEDFLSFILKNCVRAQKIWKTIPPSLVNLRELRALVPPTEAQEISQLPLNRLIHQPPCGITKSKQQEMFIEHLAISKIFLDNFKIDINKPTYSDPDPKTLDKTVYPKIRAFIYTSPKNIPRDTLYTLDKLNTDLNIR